MSYSLILGLLLGLVVGSFLNVVISRYGSTSSPLRGRSRCPHCRRELSWWELIPLASYLLLKGRCRTCANSIGLRYPLVELISGIGTALIINAVTDPWRAASYLVIFWTSLVIVAIDLRLMLIPDQATSLVALMVAFLHWRMHDLTFLSIIFGLLVGGGILLLIVATTRGRGMGWGDVKLGAALGILLGWPMILVGLFLAIIIGAFVGSLLVVFRRLKLKSAIPFAPFLLLGSFLAMLWGKQLIEWYLSYGSF